MTTESPMLKCLSYIDSQLSAAKKAPLASRRQWERPVVTLSRQTGSGALPIAEKLAVYLQAHDPTASCPWTVFDKNLFEQVLEDHHLPKRLAQFMPEDRVSQMEDFMAELLGLRPSTWTLVHQTTETVLRLADLGHVILVGRGATVITRKLPQAFHVRLVGSLERRIARVQEYRPIEAKEAAEFVRKTDEGRIRYLKTHFHRNIDDPLLYHIIINTDEVSLDEAARLIGETVIARIRAGLGESAATNP